MDDIDDFEAFDVGQVIRSIDPFAMRQFPFELQPYSNPLKEDENNRSILKENGLIPGGIMALILFISLSYYFLRGLLDLLSQTPAHSLTVEPVHLLEKHEIEKTYTAYKDRFHWNFGVGFKKSNSYPNFNIFDNDYI